MEEGSDPTKLPPPRPIAPPRRSLEETQLNKFKRFHAEAYAATSTAMALDEQQKREDAFKAYQDALLKIDKAVTFAHSGGFPSGEVDKVDELVYKMRMTRKEILERVSDLQHVTPAFPGPSSNSGGYLDGPSNTAQDTTSTNAGQFPGGVSRIPPPYSSESAGPSQSSSDNLYGQMSGALDQIAMDQSIFPDPLPINAQEVFSIPDNIQIYYIGTDDNVMAPSYPSFLRLVVLDSESPASETPTQVQRPPAFLQVGDWTYPLIPGQSPVFHAADGSYIFPDVTPGSEGASVGLILPPEVPKDQRKQLDELLLRLIGLEAFPILAVPAEEVVSEELPASKEDDKSKIRGKQPLVVPEATSTRMSTRIAEGLMSGAETVAQGLIVGAEKTSDLLNRGTHYVIGKIHPAEENTKITPEVKGYVKKAKTITGHTVQISGYLVSQLGRGTMYLGRKVAPYVQSSTAKLYAKTTNSDETDANRKVDKVLEISGGALVGFGTVYMGLEHAAKVLASSLASNSVRIVHHRYGHEAGGVAKDAATTVGNTVMTGMNVQCLGPKALAKRVVKDAGKASLNPDNRIPKPKQ